MKVTGWISLGAVVVGCGGITAIGSDGQGVGAADKESGSSGSGGSGGSVDADGSIAFGDSSASRESGGSVGSACWASSVMVVTPRTPTISKDAACAVTETPLDPSSFTDADGDPRSAIVGRWSNCGSGLIWDSDAPGIEFGDNHKWQLIESDGTPKANGPSGYYFLLSTGQLDLISGEWDRIGFLSFDPDFNVATYDTYDVGATTQRFARVAPDTESAAQNALSTTDGKCSLIGDWDTVPNGTDPSASYSFDGAGNWVACDLGSDLCAEHSMHGLYELSTGAFTLVTLSGMGQCQFWFSGYFRASFDATCTTLSLSVTGDNCTGGRGYLNGDSVLKKRQ